MTWLDDLLGKQIKKDGVILPQRKTLNILGSASVSVADNPSTGETDLTIDPGLPANNTVTTAMIQDAAITPQKLAVMNARTILGNASGTDFVSPGPIGGGADGSVLRRSGATLGFGTIATAGITDDAVTGPKIRLANASPLRARNAANSADVNLFRLTSGDLLDLETAPLFGSTSSTESIASGALSLTTLRSTLTVPTTYTLAAGTQGQIKFVYNGVAGGGPVTITTSSQNTIVIGQAGVAVLWVAGAVWKLIGGVRATSTADFAAAGTWAGISTHVRCTGTTYTISMPTTGVGQQVFVENAASGNVTFGGQVMATGTRYLYVYLDSGWRRTALT